MGQINTFTHKNMLASKRKGQISGFELQLKEGKLMGVGGQSSEVILNITMMMDLLLFKSLKSLKNTFLEDFFLKM